MALLKGVRTAVFPAYGKLRFINYCAWHGCDLAGKCAVKGQVFCQVPFHKIVDHSSGKEKIMTKEERRYAFRKLWLLSSPETIVSILGGETTLRPELLLEIVEDISKIGFHVNVVTNGFALNPELIAQLAEAGLHHLAISVDCEEGPRQNLYQMLELHQITRENRIIPVINVLVSSNTEIGSLKKFCQKVIDAKCFVSLLAISPDVGGIFSSADLAMVPANQQLRKIIPWLAWKKAMTGLVTSSFGYLWILYKSGRFQENHVRLWHCAPHFRGINGNGRGFLFMDSDGTIGPCQEFRSNLNLLKIPDELLSLRYIDSQFSSITMRCDHCIYNCYIMEETVKGIKALAEFSTAMRMIRAKQTFHQ